MAELFGSLDSFNPPPSPLAEQTAHGGFPEPEGGRGAPLHLQEVAQRAGGRQGHRARRGPVSGQQAEAEELPEETLQGRQVGPGGSRPCPFC